MKIIAHSKMFVSHIYLYALLKPTFSVQYITIRISKPQRLKMIRKTFQINQILNPKNKKIKAKEADKENIKFLITSFVSHYPSLNLKKKSEHFYMQYLYLPPKT